MALPLDDLPDPPRIPFPVMPRTEQITRSLGEHEVLMTFASDDYAELFTEWLHSGGWNAFLAWEVSRKGD